MSCVLRIEGVNFKVDEFVSNTKLNPYKIFHIGDSIIPNIKNNIFNTSGCSFDLTKEDFEDFYIQQEQAVVFLKDNYNVFKTIYNYGLNSNERPVVDFGFYTRMFDVDIQVDSFDPELLKLIIELNFDLIISQYKP